MGTRHQMSIQTSSHIQNKRHSLRANETLYKARIEKTVI